MVEYYNEREVYYAPCNIDVKMYNRINTNNPQACGANAAVDDSKLYFREITSGLTHAYDSYSHARERLYNLKDLKKELLSQAYGLYMRELLAMEAYHNCNHKTGHLPSGNEYCYADSLDTLAIMTSSSQSSNMPVCYYSSGGINECHILSDNNLIEEVVFRGKLVSNECAACIIHNKHIKHLSFIDTSVTGEIFRIIGSSKTVQSLTVSNSNLSQGSTSSLKNATSLKKLVLSKCDLPNNQSYVIPGLCSLGLSYSNYSDDAVRTAISENIALMDLMVSGGAITNGTLLEFAKTHRRRIDADYCEYVSIPLHRFSSIENVSIKGTLYSLKDIFSFIESYPLIRIAF